MTVNQIIERNGLQQIDGVWSNQTHVLCLHKPSNQYDVIGKDSFKLAQANGYELYIKAIEPPKEALIFEAIDESTANQQIDTITSKRGRKPAVK
jgi:hypothetical protein